MIADKVLRQIRENGMISRGEKVLLALSGGADSSVLLDILLALAEELEFSVCAAHLNHLLRGEDADADEEFVRKKCEELNVPLICERVDVSAYSKKTGQSVELAARNVRYDFLNRAKESFGASKIATAHNANDNLETMLFNISRGTGLRGICGIPPVRDDIIRPLISTSREEIEQYARKRKISFCTDKTNNETDYSRNKLRHEAVPVLCEINSNAVENAARAATVLRSETRLLDKLAREAWKKLSISPASCRADELAELDEALAFRVCEFFYNEVAGENAPTLEFVHFRAIMEICLKDSPSKKVGLPGGCIARREYESLVFEKRKEARQLDEILLSEGEYSFGDYAVSVKKEEKHGKIHNSLNTFVFSCDRIQGDMVLRPRKRGDEICLARRPRKTLKKLFIDEHVPQGERDEIPVLADELGVAAVFGIGVDKRFCSEEEGKALIITIEKK